MTTRNELLNNKIKYMKLSQKLWKQLEFQPSIHLSKAELSQFNARKKEVLKELDFCNEILKGIAKQFDDMEV